MELTERLKYEEPCKIRSEYQRDRDRIIHSNAFRRLKHKTQVFIAPKGDHYRTRLTHTLEVCGVARTIARACSLNEDLAEAISLGHDLGHTPFGHVGERALDEMYKFKHNEHSLRVVDKLARDGKGLNLCYATRDGILCHSKNLKAVTAEGRIVNISDRIAYVNHDIDDALSAKAIVFDDLPKKSIEILGKTHSERINTLVLAMINYYKETGEIGMKTEIYEALMNLRAFMFENVYLSKTRTQEEKALMLVKKLYEYFYQNYDKIPKEYDEVILEQRVCDYIASMSDRYAIEMFENLFVPRSFGM